jgi:drug/metabolite transporter (DMT)-like permease
MQDDYNKWLGTLLIIGSAVAYSLSGYFTRLITLDVWTLLFWRGIFGGLFIGAYVAWRHRNDLLGSVRATGMAGLGVMLLSDLLHQCSASSSRGRRHDDTRGASIYDRDPNAGLHR